MSILSKVNIISKFLRFIYGDYWSKWQGAIILKTLIPFIFLSMLYLWYFSIRNAFSTLNLVVLSTAEPWSLISGGFFFILLVISFIIIFVIEFLPLRHMNKSIKRMLNHFGTESTRLFKLKKKMQIDLSREIKFSLFKVSIKSVIPTFINVMRYLFYLSLIATIVFLISFICSVVIHFQIIRWIYQNFETFTIFDYTFSFVGTIKGYLIHPIMVLFYIPLFFIFLAFVGAASANLERRSRKGLIYSIFTLLQSINIVGRFARACSITLYCLFLQDIRETSQEVIILSPRDLQVALAKTIGKNREMCQITLRFGGKIDKDEEKELKEIIKRELPKKFRKLLKRGEGVVAKQFEKLYNELEKGGSHLILAVTKDGCKFLAFGKEVFSMSIKYSIWCEDPMVKDKIIKSVGI